MGAGALEVNGYAMRFLTKTAPAKAQSRKEDREAFGMHSRSIEVRKR